MPVKKEKGQMELEAEKLGMTLTEWKELQTKLFNEKWNKSQK